MHPAIRDKPHHMRRAAGLFQRLDKVQQRLMGGKRAFLDRKIDLSQIHRDDTTSPDIGMPHLGVAHLPLWQTHIRPESGQRRRRAALHDPVDMRGLCQKGRVSLGVIAQAPPIQNAQYDRFWGVHPETAPQVYSGFASFSGSVADGEPNSTQFTNL